MFFSNIKNKSKIIIFLIAFMLFSFSHNCLSQIVVDMDTYVPIKSNSQAHGFTTINAEITETGKMIDYYDGHYVTNVKGRIIISNPSEYDLYSVRIPFRRDSGLNMIETTNTGYLFYESINIPIITPHQSIEIGYQYIGITLERPKDKNVNILNTAIEKEKIRMYTDLQLKLEKGPLENQSGEWRRLISVNIMNPSNFVVQALNIKLIKTEPGEMDVNNESRIWQFHDTLLIPRTMMVADVLDYTNIYSEIYWVSADTSVASFNITPINNIEYYTEKDLSGQLENELIDAIISESSPTEMPYNEMLILRKFISDTLIKINQTITVKNLIYNFDDSTRTVNLLDYIPDNFELVEIESNEDRTPSYVYERNMSWKEIKINPKSGRIFTYRLKFINSNVTGVQYIKGAILEFPFGRITSSNIPVILQFLPEKKIYLQKKVSILSDEEYMIEIEIKNLGEEEFVENLMLKEDIPDTNIFSEINKPFLKRGLWEIKRINKNDIWKLTYITDDKTTLQKIPQIFGIEQNSVFVTLTVDNQIKSSIINKMQKSEKIGLIILVIILLMYIANMFKKKK